MKLKFFNAYKRVKRAGKCDNWWDRQNCNFFFSLLLLSSSFSFRYTLVEDLCLTIVLSRAQNFCINRCKQKRLRILWYPVLAKNETIDAKYCETFTIHVYFIADFPRLNFLYHICKKVFFTNSRQLFQFMFVGANRIINQLTWALCSYSCFHGLFSIFMYLILYNFMISVYVFCTIWQKYFHNT